MNAELIAEFEKLASLMRKPKEKKPRPEIPAGCRNCNGRPFVFDRTEGGMKRCDCPRGVWYTQQDRARTLRRPS